jgi:hypothetical protein
MSSRVVAGTPAAAGDPRSDSPAAGRRDGNSVMPRPRRAADTNAARRRRKIILF